MTRLAGVILVCFGALLLLPVMVSIADGWMWIIADSSLSGIEWGEDSGAKFWSAYLLMVVAAPVICVGVMLSKWE